MKFTIKKFLLLSVLLSILIYQTKQDCENLCYTHTVSNVANCKICYFECPHSTEVLMTSCTYENEETNEYKQLEEAQCKSQCYPEEVEKISPVEQLSEKLNINVEPSVNREVSLHKLTSEEFRKYLEDEERDFDLTVFAMVVGCAIFTVIAIIVILKYFDSEDGEKPTIATSYTDQEEKDLPDILTDSASSYEVEKEPVPGKLIL